MRAAQGYTFILRKLHSLLGIIPIGAFLLEHLLSNFEALKGPAAYGAQVKFLNGLPMVRVLEMCGNALSLQLALLDDQRVHRHPARSGGFTTLHSRRTVGTAVG